MNRNDQLRFDPTSPMLRKVFALAAVAATVVTLGFIDALSHGYGMSTPVTAPHAPSVVARA